MYKLLMKKQHKQTSSIYTQQQMEPAMNMTKMKIQTISQKLIFDNRWRCTVRISWTVHLNEHGYVQESIVVRK